LFLCLDHFKGKKSNQCLDPGLPRAENDRIKNHGHGFWAELNKLVGDAKAMRKNEFTSRLTVDFFFPMINLSVFKPL
jgi:hypothetical protein